MRKPIIIGNWKMNQKASEGHQFLHELEQALAGKTIDIDWAIAAPFTTLPYVMPHSHGEDEPFTMPLAAQNFHWESNGAYTGEISLSMLEELGIKYAVVGHSERRQYFAETNETVNKKVKAALASTITPIMAYGESESEFDANKTMTVVKKQIIEGLKGIDAKEIPNLVLAYEPIWAIGTGKTATAQQAQDVIKASRDIIAEEFGKEAANKVRIQYGGSVKPENIKELMLMEDIDGALVGGASVEAESFAALVTYK